MDLGLKDKVAIITGAASGLGRCTAEYMRREGVRLVLADMDAPRLEAVAAELRERGGEAHGIVTDVRDYASCRALVAGAIRACGHVDILVNSAGANGPIAPLVDYPLDGWRWTMALNLDGVFHCCRAVVPVMQKAGYGRIVNLASIAGKEGNPNASCYAAAKAGVIGLTKSLGKELAATNIRVNAVAPAAIDTEMLAQVTPEFRAMVIAKIPMGRLGRAEEVADIVNWLASAECSFCTGAVFDVSGGRATY